MFSAIKQFLIIIGLYVVNAVGCDLDFPFHWLCSEVGAEKSVDDSFATYYKEKLFDC